MSDTFSFDIQTKGTSNTITRGLKSNTHPKNGTNGSLFFRYLRCTRNLSNIK